MLKKLISVLALTNSILLLAGPAAGAAEGDATPAEDQATTTTVVESTGGEITVLEATTTTTVMAVTTTTAAPVTTTTAAPVTTTTGLVEPTTTTTGDPFLDQAGRLYRATLGREADSPGQAFWADRLREGYPPQEVARFMLDSVEAQQSTGDVIIDAYRWALGRNPEAGGYAYWSSFPDPAIAVAAVSDSREHQIITGTLPPPSRVAVAAEAAAPNGSHPVGWVDAGNVVWLPKILLSIRWCESRDSYTARNSRSTASGGYQFLNSSWAAYGHAARYGVRRSMDATPAQQDEAALMTWERDGTRPWYASRHCWS
ncbi:MAG: DUF4214 domain-containing protein [Acidimicrobiales bacterium]